jgi:hypothetical protein
MGGETVYRKSWFGTVKIIVMLAVLGGLFLWATAGTGNERWGLGAFIAFGMGFTLYVQFNNGPHSVTVTERGLEFRRWRKRAFVAWEDIAEVRVKQWAGRKGSLRPISVVRVVARGGATHYVNPISTLTEPCSWPIALFDPRVSRRFDPQFNEKVAELRSHLRADTTSV